MALVAALAAIPALAQATPVVDGVLDSDYGTALATSPKDDLSVWAPSSINDPADPAAKILDSTAIYATNSGNSLYVFVRLPYFSLQTAYGDWALAVHLGGANDAIAVTNTTKDPYGIPVYYNYASNPNAIIKANLVSSATHGDGVNGWGYLNTPNTALTGWQFTGAGDYFGSAALGRPTSTTTVFHSVGTTGSEIAYVNGDGTGANGGIEMKIPFADFAHDGNLTAPVVGDTLKFQFYASVRDGTSGDGHARAAIDCEPFEDGARWQSDGIGGRDYTVGVLTQQVSYTIKSATTPMNVQGASFVDPTHIKVQFTDNLGTGATTASNYAITDLTTAGSPFAATAAVIDATLLSQADLTVPTLSPGHQYKIVVSNVQSSGGILVTDTLNSATFYSGIPVVFNVYDPTDVYTTNAATIMTVTGSFNNWTNSDAGTSEPQFTLVDAPTHHWQTGTVYVQPPGGNNIVEYKLRLPGTGNAWNALQGGGNSGNPDNRALVLAPGTVSASTLDYTETTIPVQVTFNLTDNENRAGGGDVYIAGMYINSYNFTDVATALKMTKTGANTYSITAPVPQGYDRYKYFTATVDPTDATKLVPNYDVFSVPNLYVTIIGSGSPLAQIVNDVIGVVPVTAAQVLRVAAGLDLGPTPASSTAFAAMDKDADGKITILDAVKLLKP
jgi:hypothetical protein